MENSEERPLYTSGKVNYDYEQSPPSTADAPGVPKRYNHHHFWINGGKLYESYNTIRGLRYLRIKDVPGMVNTEKCSESCLTYIYKNYYQ